MKIRLGGGNLITTYCAKTSRGPVRGPKGPGINWHAVGYKDNFLEVFKIIGGRKSCVKENYKQFLKKLHQGTQKAVNIQNRW